MEKVWAGRFQKALDREADDFNSSIHFDSRMFRQDIRGSMAHAAMLGAKNIIAQCDAERIIDTLGEILHDLETGALDFDWAAEDIHMCIEAELTKRIGDVGKKLHTSRSRNEMRERISFHLVSASASTCPQYFLYTSLSPPSQYSPERSPIDAITSL
jgi:argininosuccinate lyase